MYLDFASRALLGLVFAMAVLGKSRSPASFAEFVRSVSQLGVRRWTTVVAGVVLATEASAVALLAFPATTLAGYGLSAALLTAFVVAILRGTRTGRVARCACFGAGGQRLGATHVVRNCLLAVVAGAGATADLVWTGGSAPPVAAVTAAATGLVLAIPFVRWDEITYLLHGSTDARRS